MPPTRIGPYRLLRLLAQGGMGRVYLAQDLRLGRVVALKMAHADLAERAEARAQFLVEARATARLSHPNVVPVFDVGEHDGAPWAAYEFVEGRTLKQRLREGPLPFGDALRVISEIASAVEAAHADGIVHRDLKPSNVVLGADGRARVLDFGIARLIGAADAPDDPGSVADSPEALEMLGTPAYMAPEQWSREDHAPADVWALGLLACEVFLGTQPLLRRGTPEILAELMRDTRLPMPPGFDGLPAPLQTLVRACLEKDSARRPSAAEVVATVEALDTTSSRVSGVASRELDTDSFRGRARLLSALEEHLQRAAWTLVVGPPGAGKSALVRAYVSKLAAPVVSVDAGGDVSSVLALALHAARRDTEEELTWIDGAPTDTLGARRLRSPSELAAWMRESPERMALVLTELASASSETLIFVVDRLEALVAESTSDDVRAFSAALFALALSNDERIRVVATVDEGALGRLPTSLFATASVMRVEPPDVEELSVIALETLAAAGVRVADPDALDEVMELLAGDAGAFVLLRFVLLDAWRRRDADDGTVSFEPFRGTGATSLLARHADAVFDAVDERDQPIVRQLLVQLVLARHDSPFDALTVPPALVEVILRGGLVRRDVDGRLVLAHPSLPTAWRRLARWIAEHDGDAWIVREAIEAHRRWLERGRSDDDLLRGRILHAARVALERRPSTPEVAEFVRRSVRAEARARARWRLLRAAFVVAAVLALVGLGVAGWSSRRRADDAESARAASERDRAELLARSARLHWESGDVRTARAQLRRSLELADTLAGRVLHAELARDPERWRMRHVGIAYDVTLDDAGRSAFVAWQTGELSRFDLATGEERRVRASDDQLLSAVALDSERVVTGDAAGQLLLWTTSDPVLRSDTIARFERGILRLVRAGDDALIVSLLGGEVRLVRLDSARRMGSAPSTPDAIPGAPGDTRLGVDAGVGAGVVDLGVTAQGLVWERDTRVFAATSSGRVLRLDLTSGEVESIATVGPAHSMTRANANTLAVGGTDGRVHFVDVRTGRTWSRPVTHGRIRALVAVDDDSLLVASLDGGDLVLVTDDSATPLSVEGTSIVALAVHGDLAVLGLGNGMRVFDWRVDPRPSVAASEPVLGVVLTPSAVFSTSNGTFAENDLRTGEERRRFTPFGPREIRALALAPQGDRIAAWFGGLGVAIVDLRSGAPMALSFEGSRRVLDMRPHGDGIVYGTSDGDLVSLGWDGTVRRTATEGPAIFAVESLGESAILSAHSDGSVRLTDGSTSRELRRFDHAPAGLFAHEDRWHVLLQDGSLHRLEADGDTHALASARTRVYRGVLSRDGARVVAPGADGALHLWSLPDGTHHALPLSRRELNVVALDEDGEHAAVGGDDGIVRFVDLRDGRSPWARDDTNTALTTSLENARGRWRGEADGTLVHHGEDGAEERLQSAVSLPIVHLASGPHDTLVVAQAAGHLELRHGSTRERIARARLRGEIVHVEVDGERVRAQSDTGQEVELDLSHLGAPRCELVRAIWASSPLSWGRSDARVEPPPRGHECLVDP